MQLFNNMISLKSDPVFIMNRIHIQTLSVFLILLMAVSCAPSQQAVQTGSSGSLSVSQLDEITEMVSQMPAADETEQQWLNARFVEMGAPAMHALAGMLKVPANGDDTGTRYAVNGLAKHVSRPGADAERSTFEQVIITELKKNHPAGVDIFLIEQLELIGSTAAVSLLKSFVGEEELHEPAVQALRSINAEQSVEALAQELSKTEGEQRIALIKALGDMEASSSQVVQQISAYAGSSNSGTRDAALYALAKSGNPEAVESISQAGEVHYQLMLARRLAEEGYLQESEQMAREIYSGEHPTHVRLAALNTIYNDSSEETLSLDLLREAAQDSDHELRSGALEIARGLQGAEVTKAFVGQLDQSSPAVQANIISMLGKRGDVSAWESVKPYLRDKNPEVRLAAVTSAVSLADSDALPELIGVLNSTDETSQKEIDAIKAALFQLPSEPLFEAASRRWMNLSGTAKVALIEILASRRQNEYLDDALGQLDSSEDRVRLALLRAIKELATFDDLPKIIDLLSEARSDEELDIIREAIVSVAMDISDPEQRAAPVLSALEEASSTDERISLMKILPEIGGEEALQAVVSATKSSDTDIRSAAGEALAGWRGPDAVEPLLQVFRNAPDTGRQNLLDGLLRLVRDTKYSDSTKVGFLSDALDAASGDEEKTAIFEGLSEIHSTAGLRAVSAYFHDGDQNVREQSYRAAAEILAPAYDFSSEFDGTDKVLAVLESTTDSQTKQKIEEQITRLQSEQKAAEGFTSLFNGRDLTGWTGDKDAWHVTGEQLIHREGESGNLFTEQEYSDFILRFQFKLTPGANNGLAIRAPLQGDPAYEALELQILDNTADQYKDLQPFQYHGSVYGVAPAERGHLKPTGEWNTQEVVANGSNLTVKLNGVTILETNIKEAGSPETPDGKDHPGLLRTGGHIGFLGHGDEVAFRNIRIRDLNVYYPDYSMGTENAGGLNHPPEGFKALFNGENLEGWKGLVGTPESRAEMSEQELAEAQKEADIVMQEHWSVRDGILYFDGEGESLTTEKDYKDFEMLLDWKIEPGGDSGVYLRGSPQVQIWDITQWPVGSGGLYNNQQHLSEPLVPADNAIGKWNRMRIKMIGERVTVHLNGQLVVPDVIMENYWNRDKPIYSEGQLELQAHSTPLYFKNVFIREIPRTEPLFNGRDLTGWQPVGGNAGIWNADDGLLYTEGDGEEWEQGAGGGWLSTERMYDNFKLELEYRLPEGGNSGVFLRAPHEGDPAYRGIEIQLLDDYSEEYAGLEPWQYTGSLYGVKAPSSQVTKQAGQWQKMEIIADGPRLKVTLNGELIVNTSLINHMKKVDEHPGLKRRKGYIGLQNHNSRVEFRNINITEIE